MTDQQKREWVRDTCKELNDELIKVILENLTTFKSLEKFKKYVEASQLRQNEWIGGVYDTITIIEEFFIGKRDEMG